MDCCTTISRALADALVAGPFDVDALVMRGTRVLGRRPRWLRPLARRLSAEFAGGPRPRQAAVAEFLACDEGFLRACEADEFEIATWLRARDAMTPLAAASTWQLPPIRTVGELAEWLAVGQAELDWFADRRGWESRRGGARLRHYHYRTLARQFGQIRLIEAPKSRLKRLQRKILAGILDRIPPHPAAHGFRAGRSILSFAAPHVGQAVVVRIDLADFFPSILQARIGAVFRSAGYPEPVADLLTGLCCNQTPPDIWDTIEGAPGAGPRNTTRWTYARPHLPQGAPTSPALANLCAYRLDCRLSGLAAAAGAAYTRYADDLAFSGDEDFARTARRFCLHVSATVMEEGFSVCFRKTRIMRRGVRQHLAGIVLNEKPNLRRVEHDRLKATLTNCLRSGPASQNRSRHEDFRGHLLGRIAFAEMVNPSRGQRLRKLFEQIDWSADG